MRPAALLLLLLPSAAVGQTSFPMVTHVTPVAVQRGTTAEVTVECRTSSLADAYKVLVEGTGVTAEPLPSKLTASVKLKVTAAADAAPGVREFRVATKHGVSSLGQLLVVDDPVVLEVAGANTPAKAQKVPVPSVVCGRLEGLENVDYYQFAATAGQTLTFEVHCARIQDKIHDLQKHADPFVAVFDLDGRELASSDDAFFADPVMAFKVPKDGEYRVAIREAKYDGDPRWAYALTVTDKPFAHHVFPLGVKRGTTSTVVPVLSDGTRPKWTLTAPPAVGIQTVTFRGAGSTNPVPVVVTDLDTPVEVEPNDAPAAATRVTVPCGVNGRIGAKRDLDHFVFAGVKGKAVRLEVFARRFGTVLRSQLDSQLDVMTPDGKVLASNDDLNGKDAGLVFTPPVDGDYVVRVRDLNNKGGDAFVYFLEVDFARPDFTLKCDPSKAMIGPGSRTAWYVQVARTNGFAGPVKVDVRGLPAGVTVNPLTIPANMTQGCLVVTAAADAKVDAAVVSVVGTADGMERTAVAVEEIYLPGGGRGRFDAGMQAVAVTGPSDILQVKVKKNEIVLKPGEEVKLDVELVRREGLTAGLTLDVQLRHLGSVFGNPLPPGVTMLDGKSKTLLGAGNTGHITLKADATAAECDRVPVCVQAFVPINFVVKIGYASEPIYLTIKKN